MANEQKLVIRFEAQQDSESGVWIWTALIDPSSNIETDVSIFALNALTAQGDTPIIAAYNLIDKLYEEDEIAYNQITNP